MNLSIYTQNCFGIPVPRTHLRLKKIAEKILEISPDVVFLQEIQWKRHVPIFDLPNYQMFFDDGSFATKGGLLTLVRKDFLGKHGFVKFDSQGGVKQIADRALGKGILDVVLESENIHLINTHLMSTYSIKFIPDTRQKKQIEQLLQYVKPLKKVIGAGDLNFPEKSEYYDLLMKEVSDLSLELGNSHEMIKSKLDFVFGKGIKRILEKEYLEYKSFVSDHKGIYCKIEL